MTPTFSAWSPVVAVVGALVASLAPGWVTLIVWGLAVVCALPFARFRLVVPLALLTWAGGWLASFAVRLTESGLVGQFLVK
ncbi:hypothetical protein PT015_21555 [Candidatus Mycobacterium wuenschmannii]|uniref:Uncharacterized protein n=1 Tax=Candidatus Mycobacterium wuenschmannii TaxID=3027808 RepID=A0ABY8VYX6_9MYCO|nr:hypothetical protein [Candidatus Mycobacterium wuenschmannii]WIM87397.1 hypothetical protein PT015_21555 [Candidatus Mycobacterium wuenschmannii]